MLKRIFVLAALTGALSATTVTADAVTTTVTVAAAGDIACGSAGTTVTATTCQQAATEKLAASLAPKYVLPLGDLVYDSGSLTNFQKYYDPSWGQLKSISKPVPGNHERGSAGLAGYYSYFGSRATPLEPTCRSGCKGYYSFSTGSWHVVALNTAACTENGTNCGDFSAQAAWLKADLAAHPAKCTLAYLHHPYWANGVAATAATKPLYQALYTGGVDVVLAGHAHHYERYKQQNMSGQLSTQGLTEYVVGTGGVNQQPVGSGMPNRAAAFTDFGVLKLSLRSGGWDSSFRSISGATKDSVTGTCH